MTTQHFDTGEASFGISKGPGNVLRIAASDPEQPGRTALFAVPNSLNTDSPYGFGPIFSMDVLRPIEIN